ncbi:MAG: methylmalonyl Co-A mutase-associated GTPase MeaB [Chloroflexota bacterium]
MSNVQSILEGNRLALARLLTQIENNTAEGRAALSELFPHTGQAHWIGVTGAPGTGKSSLVNQLARQFRSPEQGEPQRVAIVAVDPSSPFTGGAILGDRVRMRDLAGDPGVFIRSMASRGSLGGLAVATSGVVQALDAAGFEIILIETVGAGQAEVDIARLAHTTLVIESPGLGDDIQAIKAGILEIADVLVVNKADRPGVEATERALRSMLQLAHPVPHVFRNHVSHKPGHEQVEETPSANEAALWVPPIQRTVAIEGTGVSELVESIRRHYAYLEETGELEQREQARMQSELDLLLRETLVARWRSTVSDAQYNLALQRLVQRQLSPWQAVDWLVQASG